jgi:hypothetical protein
MDRTYDCDVVAYPCVTLPDGSTGYCHELSCTVGRSARPGVRPNGVAGAPGFGDDVAVDEHEPSFGVQGPGDGALHIPLRSLVAVLEQMGATVSFDDDAFRQSAERYLVRAGA